MTVLSVATVLGFYLPLVDWLRIKFPEELEEYLKMKDDDDEGTDYVQQLLNHVTFNHNIFSCDTGIYGCGINLNLASLRRGKKYSRTI